MKSDNVWKEYKEYMDEHRDGLIINTIIFTIVIFVLLTFLYVIIGNIIYIDKTYNNFNNVEVLIFTVINLFLSMIAGFINYKLGKRKLLRNYVYYKIGDDRK